MLYLKANLYFFLILLQVRRYNTYKSWWFTGTLYIALVTIIALAIFEDPTVSSLETFAKEKFWVMVSQSPKLRITLSLSSFQILIEIFCLGFFLFRLAHEFLFSQRRMFWRDAKHLMVIAILALTVLDICVYTGLAETGVQSVRWSRPLRPLLIVNIPEGENYENKLHDHP